MTSQKKILVVEDNKMNRMMLSGILSSEYTVLEAENGQDALDVLRQHGEDISLILLDIIMPVMDGYTFLSLVKADPDYSAIPVIVTTQNDGESDEVAALSHGATDFVVKPYKPKIILHRVASIINLRETAAMVNLLQYDRLTGLYSKEFFYQRAKEELLHHPDVPYDIVCSDIENFKLINDVFGMPAGDRLLRGIAEIYNDLVGDRGICGRLNADQFACLLQHREYYTDDMFIRACENIKGLPNTRNVSMKWGIYTVGERVTSIEQMCDRALLAARSVKGQYGKYFARYDDALRSKLLREQAITDGMETALAEGQFTVYLQPKFSLQDDSLAGAEALVRWNHPEWGFQSPATFIPLFEKSGFITKLDQFVWDSVCAVLRQWSDMGYPAIPVSVNVSRADIYNADLTDILMQTIRKYALSPSQLHLEITESAYTENPEQIIETVSRLRNLGFVIEMDDFGSGYSSLNMLNRMPLDILKLDMAFIQSETAKPVSQGILRFIMSLARWMDLHVVAEGVETREQLERLREIGCDYVQGYYFAKPMPCSEFEELMKKQRPVAGALNWRTQEEMGEQQRPVLLIADEDPRCRQEARRAFERDFRVVEAATGEAALTCLLSYEYKMAAVILSMTLSEATGDAVFKTLQREKTVRDFPALLTAPSEDLREELALELGADDFLAKPYSNRVLRERVLRAIENAAVRDKERICREEARHDFLTGLLNRRGLDDAVCSLCADDIPFAVCLLDLDNLKQINDTQGHRQGDRLIQQFAALLRGYTREDDILARFGGDEFIIIMKRTDTAERALEQGLAICRAVQEVVFAQEMSLSCTAGVAMGYATDGAASVIDRADQALYGAKMGNKGGCCLWREENR